MFEAKESARRPLFNVNKLPSAVVSVCTAAAMTVAVAADILDVHINSSSTLIILHHELKFVVQEPAVFGIGGNNVPLRRTHIFFI